MVPCTYLPTIVFYLEMFNKTLFWVLFLVSLPIINKTILSMHFWNWEEKALLFKGVLNWMKTCYCFFLGSVSAGIFPPIMMRNLYSHTRRFYHSIYLRCITILICAQMIPKAQKLPLIENRFLLMKQEVEN